MTCCESISKGYIFTTNFLSACFGCGLIAFGMMGSQHKFDGAFLFPMNILKMINILGIIILFAAAVGTFGAFYRHRQTLHVLYTTIVLIAFVYQVATAGIVYDQAAHTETWLGQTWSDASREYRLYAQDKFDCCGFAHIFDHPVISDTCSLDINVNSNPPCYEFIVYFMKKQLSIIYIFLFAALSIELLALSNAVTLLCNRRMEEEDDEEQSSKCSRFFGKKSNIGPDPDSTIALGFIPQATLRQSNIEWKYARGASSPTLVDSAISDSSLKEPTTPSTIHKPEENLHTRQY
ncbi:Tetraspanin family-domain-containing protein [Spinellus fusiger]|nr:Tetraspanin family-domain-containing protein [Spinellus fusiger]